MNNSLTKEDIKYIQECAEQKLEMCKKSEDIIGLQIFSILALHARVIFYPLETNGPWGFTGMSGTQNGMKKKESFVAINSSIPVDCQVFAAAHELYHIWYRRDAEVLLSNLLDESNSEYEEKKANRFAAEFLVKEELLKQEIELHQYKNITIKSILQLADIFVVPYRTMVKRLYEISLISEAECDKFLKETEDSIERYKRIYSIEIRKPDNRFALDNLVELAVKAYESKYITYEKFEYLLSLSDLVPEDVGVNKSESIGFPSEDELDAIMGE